MIVTPHPAASTARSMRRRPALEPAAAEQQLHALADEGGVEGLGEDLVGALGEGQLHRPLRGEAHDGDRGLVDLGQGADARAHRDPVQDGQEGVEQHEVELEAPGQGQGLDPVPRLHHLDRAHVEGLAQEGPGGGVGGGDENGGRGGGGPDAVSRVTHARSANATRRTSWAGL